MFGWFKKKPNSQPLAGHPTATREDMLAALKAVCVSFLRAKGFKGTFPNFYRRSDEFTCLVNFQFFSSGGSFCVNISYAGPGGANVDSKPQTPAKNLSVSQTTDRVRLGSQETGDHWFSFGQTSYGEVRGQSESPAVIADRVNALFASHAEPWWESKRRQLTERHDAS